MLEILSSIFGENPIHNLDERDRMVLKCMIEQKKISEIAEHIGATSSTAELAKRRIYEKLGTKNWLAICSKIRLSRYRDYFGEFLF